MDGRLCDVKNMKISYYLILQRCAKNVGKIAQVKKKL